MNDSRINTRKFDHIKIINTDRETDRAKNYFDEYHLQHRAMPELDLQAIDPSIVFLGKRLSFPLLISAMTGGGQRLLHTINKNLAIAAEKTGVAMGVGSQRIMFTHASAKRSFTRSRSFLTVLISEPRYRLGFSTKGSRSSII